MGIRKLNQKNKENPTKDGGRASKLQILTTNLNSNHVFIFMIIRRASIKAETAYAFISGENKKKLTNFRLKSCANGEMGLNREENERSCKEKDQVWAGEGTHFVLFFFSGFFKSEMAKDQWVVKGFVHI